MASLQLSRGKGGKIHSSDTTEKPCNRLIKKQDELSPVQAIDHISHSVDETLVFLRVTDDEAVQLLHIGINGVQGWCLSASCMATARDKGLRTYSFNITHAGSDKSPACLWEQPGIPGIPQKTPKVTVRDDVLLLHSRIWSLHCNSAKRFRK